MKKVLITGASGFIGGHLVKAALEAGLEVYAGVRKSSNLEYLMDERIHIFPITLGSPQELEEVFKKQSFDYVVHNAGATKAPKRDLYCHINCELTKNLVNALMAAGTVPEKFVFISSLAACGPGNEESLNAITSHDIPQPITAYGESKLKAEQFLESLNGFPFVIVRPTAVYGPREKEIFTFFKLVSRGIEPLIGFKKQHLSFIYVDDLAELVLRAARHGKIGQIYLAAHEQDTSMQSVAKLAKVVLDKKTMRLHVPVSLLKIVAFLSEGIQRITGRYAAFNLEKVKELSSLNWKCDISTVKDELDFEPHTTIELGLQKTLLWYKEQKWL